MKRIASVIIIIALVLVCLSAWAGTFKEDFSRGDLTGWQLLKEGIEFIDIGKIVKIDPDPAEVVTFQVENGQLATEMDIELLAKKGKDLHPMDSSFLYFPIQLEGNNFSVSCRLKLVEIGFVPIKGVLGPISSTIGIALQADQQKQGDTITRDAYTIMLHSLGQSVNISHRHAELGVDEKGFIVSGWARGLVYSALGPISFRPQVWYRLKVEKTPLDKELKVFVDDVLFEGLVHVDQKGSKIPFSYSSEGRKLIAGFHLSGTKVKALFDDFVLSSPSVPDGPVTVESKSKLTTSWGEIKAGK